MAGRTWARDLLPACTGALVGQALLRLMPACAQRGDEDVGRRAELPVRRQDCHFQLLAPFLSSQQHLSAVHGLKVENAASGDMKRGAQKKAKESHTSAFTAFLASLSSAHSAH